MDNPKGRLQEHFQKNGGILPIYKVKRTGGSDHQPLWTSSVKLPDGQKLYGEVSTTKAEATASAANIALQVLFPNEPKEIVVKKEYELNEFTKRALLVDVENLQKFLDELDIATCRYDIYAFVGRGHHLADKVYGKGVTKVVSPSSLSDGTDTCMQVFVGMLLIQERYDEYVIATQDHFAEALVEMITSTNLGWKDKSARRITKVLQL